MQPAKLSYKVYQGSTFQESYRWESETKVYVPIQNISKAAPCVITTQVSHNMPTGWRCKVVGAGGMKEINTTSDNFYIATDTTNNTVVLNQVNSLQFSNYTGGGVLEYNMPVNLSSYKARMQIRKTVGSSEVLYESDSTTSNNLILDNVYKTISINIPASITQEFTFTSAVYSVELYEDSGLVVPFLTGTLTLVQEITR